MWEALSVLTACNIKHAVAERLPPHEAGTSNGNCRARWHAAGLINADMGVRTQFYSMSSKMNEKARTCGSATNSGERRIMGWHEVVGGSEVS